MTNNSDYDKIKGANLRKLFFETAEIFLNKDKIMNNKKNMPEKSRKAKKMEKQKIRKWRIYIVIVILIAVIIFIILALNVFFNIQNVNIEGSTNYTAEEIFNASKITVGDNMIRTNSDEISSNITSTLIYIESAEIRKIFPTTIKITVTASVPTANVRKSDGYFLISQGGKILETLQNPKSGLMNITGTDPDSSLVQGSKFISVDEEKTEAIYELLNAFEKNGIENVTDIDFTDLSNVSYVYDSRITVELGVVNDLDYKLKFADEIINNQMGSGTFGTLKLLSDSAQFIDEAGQMENDRIYESNISIYESSIAESESISIAESESISQYAEENPSSETQGTEQAEETTPPEESEESITETAPVETTME